ncbi:hypothetical protein IWQ49_001026 [Labrenzia sp. EL_126]|nr:hypothetical protein [Labrenzia sp. EL_126]
MADPKCYDDKSFEEQCVRDIQGFEKALQENQEPLEKRKLQRARSVWKCRLALWKRLFGETLCFQYTGPLEVFPTPRSWRSLERPRDPFPQLELDALVESLFEKRRGRFGRLSFLVCPYWWIRWAIYCHFGNVEKAFDDYLEQRKISARLKKASLLADKAETVLQNLAEALRDCSEIDLGLSNENRSVPYPSEDTKSGNRIFCYTDEDLFDWNELEIPALHLDLLSDLAGYLSFERQTAGRREDVRRHSFAIAVGAMWWELTGSRPTSNNTGFGDFLAASETVFFSDQDTTSRTPETSSCEQYLDVTRLVNSTAELFHKVETAEENSLRSRANEAYLDRIAKATAISSSLDNSRL